jgi:hypothetical protein
MNEASDGIGASVTDDDNLLSPRFGQAVGNKACVNVGGGAGRRIRDYGDGFGRVIDGLAEGGSRRERRPGAKDAARER